MGAVLSVLYLPILYFGVGRLLQPLARKVLMGLTIIELGLVFLHLHVFANRVEGFYKWFFDLGSEFAVGALYSAAQLLAVGIIAFIIAKYGRDFTRGQRLYWILLALLFTILNLDEYYLLHDDINEILFVALAIIGMGVILAGYWINFRQERKLFAMLFGGLVVMGLALVSDTILPNVPQQSALEEFMEMNGVTLVLVGFLSYAQLNLPQLGFQRAKRLPLIVAIAWVVLLSVFFWLVPTVEYWIFAQSTHIDYVDGDLVLTGYRLNQTSGQPGDTVNLTLYWKTNRPIQVNYGVSAHLLTHPDIQSVAQSDHLLIKYYQTNSWVPGLVTRLPVALQIPDDQSMPLSYWLQLTVWYADGYDPTDVVTHREGWLLSPDSLVLLSFPVMTTQSIDVEFTETTYHFGDKFTLSGYHMPETIDPEDSLALNFQWQIGEHDIQQQYTQFIHLFREDSFMTGLDKQPFDGRFPTTDWIPNTTVSDRVDVPLASDLPAGNYDVFTGMYDTERQERLIVTDGDEILPNGLVYLGVVRIE